MDPNAHPVLHRCHAIIGAAACAMLFLAVLLDSDWVFRGQGIYVFMFFAVSCVSYSYGWRFQR